MADLRLSPRDVVLVRGWYDGKPITEMAADLGVSRQRVSEILDGMRARGISLTARTRRRAVHG